MNIKTSNYSSIFKDKATLILRALLAHPHFKWHTRLLAKTSHTSTGLVSRCMGMLKQMGCIETGSRGRGGFITFQRPEVLLNNWTRHYDVAFNTVSCFYLPSPKDARKFFIALDQLHIRYALALHSGANLLTRYFVTDQHYLYIDYADVEKLVVRLSGNVPITRLARGGNLHLLTPYYKNSVFDRMRWFKGLPVVSNLQLYLDLFNFFPRGHEHALKLHDIVGDKLYE